MCVLISISLEMAMGWSGAEGWGLRPYSHGFDLPNPCLIPHDKKNFLNPSPPLGSRETPPVKLYFLLIYPITSTIFLMKPISLIKIYSKLQLNLSHKIKSNQF